MSQNDRIQYVVQESGEKRFTIFEIDDRGEEKFFHQFDDDTQWFPFEPCDTEVRLARKLFDAGESGWHLRFELNPPPPQENRIRNACDYLAEELPAEVGELLLAT